LPDKAAVQIKIGNPTALPSAYPLTGPAPLTVKFRSNGQDEDGTIEYFYWDYDGNGTIDATGRVSDTFTYTYYTPGTYQARLQVVDNDGLSDEKTLTIYVTSGPEGDAPEAYADAEPAQGAAPLTVDFIGLGTDNNGFIQLFEWDFDGDGTFDWQSAANGTTSHTYASDGIYRAVLRVSDDEGLTGTDSLWIKVQPEGSPVASARANLDTGTSPLEVTFSGGGTDKEGTIALYEWDFNGDGIFDWSSTESGDATYRYTSPGTYEAVLRVTDNEGLTDLIWVNIQVTSGDIKAVRSREAFDPSRGQKVTITSSLTFPTETFTLRIMDSQGNTVRTLVDHASRPFGVFTDIWNGRDDSGLIVAPGAYFFVIDYVIDGTTYHYDLTSQSGDKVTITPGYSNLFNPIEDQFLTATFTLNKPAEISAYVAPFAGGAGNRVRTIYLRTPRKSGNYVITWDGTKDDGSLAPIDQSYVMAVFAYGLSDNAIIVESNPIVSDVSTEPDFYNPDNPYHDELLRITYSLSKEADVRVQINNEVGIRMRTLFHQIVSPGINTLTWDGRTSAEQLVDVGVYNIGVKAIDAMGNESQTVYGIVRIFY